MVIAVNTRFLMKEAMEGVGYFIKEIFERITTQHPEHQFYFLFACIGRSTFLGFKRQFLGRSDFVRIYEGFFQFCSI